MMLPQYGKASFVHVNSAARGHSDCAAVQVSPMIKITATMNNFIVFFYKQLLPVWILSTDMNNALMYCAFYTSFIDIDARACVSQIRKKINKIKQNKTNTLIYIHRRWQSLSNFKVIPLLQMALQTLNMQTCRTRCKQKNSNIMKNVPRL